MYRYFVSICLNVCVCMYMSGMTVSNAVGACENA